MCVAGAGYGYKLLCESVWTKKKSELKKTHVYTNIEWLGRSEAYMREQKKQPEKILETIGGSPGNHKK